MVIFNKLLSFLHNYFDALLLEFLLSQLFTLLFIRKESDLLARLGRTSSRLKYPLNCEPSVRVVVNFSVWLCFGPGSDALARAAASSPGGRERY